MIKKITLHCTAEFVESNDGMIGSKVSIRKKDEHKHKS